MATAVTAFDQGVLCDVVGLWDLKIKSLYPEIIIAGSPERCEFRIVIEVEQDGRFILEQIFPKTLEHKKYIASTLAQLTVHGLKEVLPYRKNRDGQQILSFGESYWQMQRFLPGVDLDRPAYAFEQWRGNVMADFLIDLQKFSVGIAEGKDKPFSLKKYVLRLMKDIERCDPQYLDRIRPVFDFLEKSFFSVHDDLPIAFCHGDYHPINILWTSEGIGAVIDWEFCGYKSELYDVANMVGCLGIEHPDALSADCVLDFIQRLYTSGIYKIESWAYFFELLVAIRFGWMSEWLRKKDLEMVEMECDYWDILMNNRDQLKMMWGI